MPSFKKKKKRGGERIPWSEELDGLGKSKGNKSRHKRIISEKWRWPNRDRCCHGSCHHIFTNFLSFKSRFRFQSYNPRFGNKRCCEFCSFFVCVWRKSLFWVDTTNKPTTWFHQRLEEYSFASPISIFQFMEG